MEQNELEPNKLKHVSGCETKRMLAKKGLKEVPPVRYMSIDSRTIIGCREPFVSQERDEEIRQAWIEKRRQSQFNPFDR